VPTIIRRGAVAVVGLAVVASLIVHHGQARPALASAGLERLRCPRAIDGGPYAPEEVLAATRRILRRRTLVNQNGTIHLTPDTYTILEFAPLGPGADNPQVRHYFGLVRRRCGELDAERTWLVLINLSAAQLALPPQPLLFMRTATRWRLVYSR
jgi:hypothetical protein